MRKIFLLTTMLCMVSGTAIAEMPFPEKPYSAQVEVTANGKVVPAEMFISGSKIRMNVVADEGPASGQNVVFVADRKTGEAFTLADMNGRKMAIKMDINTAMKRISFMNQDLGPAMGTKRIGLHKCTNYKTMNGVICLTKENIILEAHDDESHMRVKKLKKGKQDASLFVIPANYQIMDLGGMLGGLGNFAGENTGSVGGINLGGLSQMGSPADIGKALSEGQNENGEGFNSIMKNLGLPTETIDTPGEGAFGNMLGGMIRNEVKGTNAEGIINGDLSATDEFRQGLEMRDEMTKALENGEDPLSALMRRNGVSDQERAKFRQKAKEGEALNAPGGFIDQQIERAQSGDAMSKLTSEIQKLEALNDEAERRLESGEFTDADRERLLKEAKEIEQRGFAAMEGK